MHNNLSEIPINNNNNNNLFQISPSLSPNNISISNSNFINNFNNNPSPIKSSVRSIQPEGHLQPLQELVDPVSRRMMIELIK